MAIIDDTFKKPGAIPFKWEIRPGVPKLQKPAPRSTSPSQHLRRSLVQHHQQPNNHHRRCDPPLKLRPPPSGFNFQSPEPELRVSSSQMVRPVKARPEVVGSGCFPGPLLKGKKDDKKRVVRSKHKIESESDYYMSEFETSSTWSQSTHKSFSSYRESPSCSSFSSYQSSPCLFSDPEWVGFGLF